MLEKGILSFVFLHDMYWTGKAMAEGNKWYFYSRRTQSRITGNGYWKSLGLDEPIFSSSSENKVGMKKYYAFYIGEQPEGVKTNWVMQEFSLSDSSNSSSGTSRSSSRRRSRSKIVRMEQNMLSLFYFFCLRSCFLSMLVFFYIFRTIVNG